MCLLLTSCTDFDWHQEHDTTLSGFDITTSDISVDLTDESVDMDETHLIEWTRSSAADYTQVFYRVLFSGTGDFENPDYTLDPGKIGLETMVEVSNQTLNIIAEAANIAQNSTGTVKWTVRATNGVATCLAESVHSLTVSRPVGFASIPESVALLCDGVKVSAFKKVAPGIFEAFVHMAPGSYKIADDQSTGKIFYGVNGQTLAMNSEFTPITENCIHHITVDFNKATADITSVEKVGLWYVGSESVIADMTPAENLTAQWSTVFLFQPVGTKLGYKFRFTGHDADGNEVETFYGYAKVVAAPQNATTAASYFYLIPEEEPSVGNYAFSFNRSLHSDKTLSVIVDMRPTIDNYTHTVVVR